MPDQDLELIERLVAVRGENDQWVFSAMQVSSLFEHCLSNYWSLRMYAPHFEEFWRPLHRVLANVPTSTRAVEITLKCNYLLGSGPERALRHRMEAWQREGPCFVTLTRLEDEEERRFALIRLGDVHVAAATTEVA